MKVYDIIYKPISISETTIWEDYDTLEDLEVTIRYAEGAALPTRLRARVEFLEYFAEMPLVLDKEKTEMSFSIPLNTHFLDHLKSLPDGVLELAQRFTLSLELIGEHNQLLFSKNELILNPWTIEASDDVLDVDDHGFEFVSEKLQPKEPIIEAFSVAAKMVYGDETKISYNDYGPQLSIGLKGGGNAPFMNFCDDFVWIKLYAEYPEDILSTLRDNRNAYPGYFILRMDYNYVFRIMTHGECSVEEFERTFHALEKLAK